MHSVGISSAVALPAALARADNGVKNEDSNQPLEASTTFQHQCSALTACRCRRPAIYEHHSIIALLYESLQCT